MTPEEVEAINRRENGRVGMVVEDAFGRRFHVTDVMPDERLRVLGDNGDAYWWNAHARTATPIRKPRRMAEDWGQK